ncbi:MAG: hypothetical protein IPI65_02525 [Bacteroidetes bacterium]|nr:hypothetical protein [Bacteroidota bacterium]
MDFKFYYGFEKLLPATAYDFNKERALKIYQFTTGVGRFILVAGFTFIYAENFWSYLSSTKNKICFIGTIILIGLMASGALISVINEWNQNLHLPAAWNEMEKYHVLTRRTS